MSAAKSGRSLNYPAGDFCTCVAGGLCGEIIWAVMEDNHFSDDILDQKAVGQKCGYCKAIIPEQRRQVARMVRVIAILWVVMGHGVWERFIPAVATVGSLVNVEPENSFLAGLLGMRKSSDFGIDNHPFVCLVKRTQPDMPGKLPLLVMLSWACGLPHSAGRRWTLGKFMYSAPLPKCFIWHLMRIRGKVLWECVPDCAIPLS